MIMPFGHISGTAIATDVTCFGSNTRVSCGLVVASWLMEVPRIHSSENDREFDAAKHEPLGSMIAYQLGARCASKVRATSDRVFMTVLG